MRAVHQEEDRVRHLNKHEPRLLRSASEMDPRVVRVRRRLEMLEELRVNTGSCGYGGTAV